MIALAATPARRRRAAGLLTPDQERDLARRRDAGDPGAVAELARRNLGLVYRLARPYRGRGLDDDDLVQHGCLGLLRAAGKFDPDAGTRFTTYATHWVRQAIRLGLFNDAGTVRAPVNAAWLVPRWRRAAAALAAELGRPPAVAEVARRLGLAPQKAARVAAATRARGVASLDRPHPGDPDGSPDVASLEDRRTPAPDAALAHAERLARLRAALGRLDPPAAEALRQTYGLDGREPLISRAVGQALGITGAGVRHRVRRAEAELRRLIDAGPDD